MRVYLAGPILGLTPSAAKQWREHVSMAIHPHKGISPLRCEPYPTGGLYENQYDDPCFGTPGAIAAKNDFDTRSCDIVLAYFPNTTRPVSIGTILECGWCMAFNKPLIVVSRDPRVVEHPIFTAKAQWIVPTLDNAIEIIKGIGEGYE